MRISDWSSDVCSSDLSRRGEIADRRQQAFFSESFHQMVEAAVHLAEHVVLRDAHILEEQLGGVLRFQPHLGEIAAALEAFHAALDDEQREAVRIVGMRLGGDRSEEHTSELQSLMRISYAVFCLKKNNTK